MSSKSLFYLYYFVSKSITHYYSPHKPVVEVLTKVFFLKDCNQKSKICSKCKILESTNVGDHHNSQHIESMSSTNSSSSMILNPSEGVSEKDARSPSFIGDTSIS
jgi:hypothetical protein